MSTMFVRWTLRKTHKFDGRQATEVLKVCVCVCVYVYMDVCKCVQAFVHLCVCIKNCVTDMWGSCEFTSPC